MKQLLVCFYLIISNFSNAQYTPLTDFTNNGALTGNLPSNNQKLLLIGNDLYGMTAEGGTYDKGTIFKIKSDGTNYQKLLDFGFENTLGNNGISPRGSLIFDGIFLYGMTSLGGIDNMGTIFKIKLDGTGFTKILEFHGTSNGSSPQGSLIADSTFLYGMTSGGGTNNIGTLFKIKFDGTSFLKLIDFNGTMNGSSPKGSLIFDGAFLYGMTNGGGANNFGTIFKIKPDSTSYNKLYDFDGANGKYPLGSLISDSVYLYGMTSSGGQNNKGVIFKVKTTGFNYSKIIDFTGLANGSTPKGSLIIDSSFLYGMTSNGGANDKGIVFKIKSDGSSFTKMLDFNGNSNGSNPEGSLLTDGNFLYSTTISGGTYNLGVLFKIKLDGFGFFKVLNFARAISGKRPNGSLVSDGTYLYGMTSEGGILDKGIIFKIKLDGSGFEKIFDFTGVSNGSTPEGSLIFDGTYLYGVAGGGLYGYGVVFKILPDGTNYNTIYNFNGLENGGEPKGSLIFDGTFLYGTTYTGGTKNNGTIYKVKLDGTSFSVMLNFDKYLSGSFPLGSLFLNGDFIYGTTANGGANNKGTIFKIKRDGTNRSIILSFNGTNGSFPNGSLIFDGVFLYGMTRIGGANGYGVIYKIMPNGTNYTKLLDFDKNNGNYPEGSLISDSIYLYGGTFYGGSTSVENGIIFKIKKDGSGYNKLIDFTRLTEGSFHPTGSLILIDKYLYGMTSYGGKNFIGTVFKTCSLVVTANTTATNICEGDSIKLTGSGENSYSWSGGVINGKAFTPPIGRTTYFVTGNGIGNCSNLDSIIINVNPRPYISLGNDVNQCGLSSILLDAGNIGSTYKWSNNGTAQKIYVSSTNAYSVLVTNQFGCVSSDTINIIIKPAPSKITTVNGAVITSNQSGANYQWLDCKADKIVFGENNQSYYPFVNGDYAVIVTLNGCVDTSICKTVTVKTSVNNIENDKKIYIYPNPNNGTFTLQSTYDGIFVVTNELGQTVSTFIMNNDNNRTINIENLSNGIYFIVGTNKTQKIIVLK